MAPGGGGYATLNSTFVNISCLSYLCFKVVCKLVHPCRPVHADSSSLAAIMGISSGFSIIKPAKNHMESADPFGDSAFLALQFTQSTSAIVSLGIGMIFYHSVLIALETYYLLQRYERGILTIFECSLEPEMLQSLASGQGSLVLRIQ